MDVSSAFQVLLERLDTLINHYYWRPQFPSQSISEEIDSYFPVDNSQSCSASQQEQNGVHYSLEFFWKMTKKVCFYFKLSIKNCLTDI